MSVIVKGMEMPKNCWECSLSDVDDDYGRCCLFSGIACLNIGRQDNCPLVEVPTPHGRLIDADALFDKVTDIGRGYYEVNGVTDEDIMDATTIIEAEGSEE